MSIATTVMTFADGSTRVIPAITAPQVRGLNEYGDVVIPLGWPDPVIKPGGCPYLIPLTPCCYRDGKGSAGTHPVVCRGCYRPVDPRYAGVTTVTVEVREPDSRTFPPGSRPGDVYVFPGPDGGCEVVVHGFAVRAAVRRILGGLSGIVVDDQLTGVTLADTVAEVSMRTATQIAASTVRHIAGARGVPTRRRYRLNNIRHPLPTDRAGAGA